MPKFRVVGGGTSPGGWVIEQTSDDDGELEATQSFETRAEAEAEVERLRGIEESR